jgi:predicted methyltransferase
MRSLLLVSCIVLLGAVGPMGHVDMYDLPYTERFAGTTHRTRVETIKQEVLAAGFELALESDLLASPSDDRTKMVFTPGTRGTTDQAFFIFRKPN